ncbi:hypothetical protein [Fibrella forsythiae]|uniref:Uncharacterized protein n=1 Tax=Fibrella forsythiae TaxID=2817061 RepID=A0ABS3JSU5_9BACT|nr:hypothetical protein [Fibrella forsythiae]MBO0953088.1 hypothetical protein [Fibrella forsythiae]
MTASNASNRPQPRAFSPVKFKSDPQASSFRWEIDLTQDGHNRVSLIEGYSKGQGFELTNKAELLMRKITNPLSPYLQKSDEIRVYENLKELPTGKLMQVPKQDQVCILILYRTNYKALSWVRHTDPLLEHLNSLYTLLNATGRLPQERSTNARKKVWFPELDHSKYTFANQEELKVFCRSMVEKHGSACMAKWWNAHLGMQPELTTPGPALLQTPPTGSEHQATQAATQGLYDKFNQR